MYNHPALIHHKKINFIHSCSIIISSTMGIGIFIIPDRLTFNAGSVGLSLIVWAICGLITGIKAFCYAELGSTFVKTGGDYIYVLEAFGPLSAFLRLFVDCLVIRPCRIALSTLFFATYILEPIYGDCTFSRHTIRLLSIMCILTISLVNCWETRWALTLMNVFTVFKLITAVIILLTGLTKLSYDSTENYKNMFNNTTNNITRISLAFFSGFLAFSNINSINYVAEELEDPIRNLPLSLALSVLIMTLVYLLTVVAYFVILPIRPVELDQPIAYVFAKEMYGDSAWIMKALVAFACMGIAHADMLTSSRLVYAGAKENQLPVILRMIQIFHYTPIPAILFITFASFFFVFFSQLLLIIEYLHYFDWAAVLVTMIAMIHLRLTAPNRYRPLRISLFWPITYSILCVGFVTLGFYAALFKMLFGIAITLIGLPFYLLLLWRRKPEWYINFKTALTQNLQKLMLVIKDEP